MLIISSYSFLHQLSSASFPASYSQPPPETTSTSSTPALALQLGGINVSVGGAAGTGVYRTTGNDSGGVSMQADGLRDVREGVLDLWGKVKQNVEQRLA